MPLKVKDGIGAWIKDFKKSDAPQFKGKSEEERRDMAIAAYLDAKRGPQKEMTEAVDVKTQKVKQLARLGLVDRQDVQKLMMAMKSIADNKPVPPKHRKIIFDAFSDLIDMITGDAQLFQKVRRGVKDD